MIEIRNAGLKGLGIFATKSITRGTRLLAEKPLLLVKSERDVFAASRQLKDEERWELMRLSTHPEKQSAVLSWMETILHAMTSKSSSASKANDTTKRPFWTSLLNYGPTLQIFRNNNFDIGSSSQALFPNIARINHSCVPNSQGNFNKKLGKFTIHSTKSIDVGDEISISYLSEHGALRPSRQNELKAKYGFICGCPACAGGKGEDGRVALQEKLHAFAEQQNASPAAELDLTKDFLKFYESEGIAGREVATMYLRAAELAKQAGQLDEVQSLAEKGLDLERICCGEDSDLFAESRARFRKIVKR